MTDIRFGMPESGPGAMGTEFSVSNSRHGTCLPDSRFGMSNPAYDMPHP